MEKDNILISKRYQLHPASATTQCPKGSTDALSQPKQKEKKIKRIVPLQSYNPCNSSTTTTKPTPDVQFFKSNAFKKESMPGTTN